MTTEDTLLARVRKLLAQAEDPSVTEAEAEAFNTKAAELIARHGIDQAMLAAAGEKRDEITQRSIVTDSPYSRDKAHLLSSIAAALRCQTVFYGTGKSTRKVIVFGFASDIERVELLYTSLLLQATSQLTHIRPDNYFGYESTAAYRRSWLAGFTAAVYRRLRTAETQATTDTPTATTTGTSAALVLRDRQDQVADAFKAAFPRLRNARSRQLTGSGYSEGTLAGSRADLGTSRIATRRSAVTH